ncbi:ATP-dependent DNA helicase [Nocardia sp. NPDC050175]|uniref:ATP-dependent DNA helicase n=1 Tax=Nocardia sp. NPDC050175 TaxID=3364317 RepID=UPI0037BDA3F7
MVAEAIDRRRHLVVRAGTGVGKTLAYLIPAILSGQRTVVSTATKQLQEQIAARDLPSLCAALGRDITWAVVKGRGNYVCQQRLIEVDAELDENRPAAYQRLFGWAETTESGDRDELTTAVSDTVWRRVSVRGDECPGRVRCPSGDTCFAERARSQATTADVVVTNHHVYAATLTSSHQMLPDHAIAVFDEAHQLEEAIRQMTSTYVDVARIARISGAPADSPLADLLETLTSHVGTHLAQAPENLDTTLQAATEMIYAAAAEQRALVSAGQESARRRAHALALIGENLALSQTTADRPRWVEGTLSQPVLRSYSADSGVHQILGDAQRRTVVLTSATIGDDIPAAFGIPCDAATTATVSSPFAYEDQAIFYCAADLPDPRQPGWAAAAHAELSTLIKAAGGRTLALFTSWNSLHAAHAAVAPTLDVDVLVQGELGRQELLRRFRDDNTSCLFGTIGLAQGTDIPGDALTLVTLDRLPFPPARDPYYQARRATARARAFQDVDLRHAQTLLAQVAGRLIRKSTDRGVFAVLDPRLANAGYRWSLVNAAPPMRRSRDSVEVCEFLRSLRPVNPDAEGPLPVDFKSLA